MREKVVDEEHPFQSYIWRAFIFYVVVDTIDRVYPRLFRISIDDLVSCLNFPGISLTC